MNTPLIYIHIYYHMKQVLFSLILCMFVFVSSLHAQAPRTISYQGVLTDGNGAFIADGNHTLTLRLYEQASGGSAVYEESQSVAVIKGIFNAFIGSVTPIPTSLAFDRAYYLGVSVDGADELVPRTAMSAAPYALFAQTAGEANSLSSNATDVVRSVNNQSGAITLQGSGGTTLSNIGNTLTINSSGWGLKGNEATNPDTNFIGTIDSNDLVFKVNGRERLRINTNGTIYPSTHGRILTTYFGVDAGLYDTSGGSNTAFGWGAMKYNRAGFGNTAFGTEALAQTDSSFGNTAVGYRTLVSNTSGHRNTGIGATVLPENTTGSYNIGVGGSALAQNKTGNRNVAVGYRSQYTDTASSGNVSLGHTTLFSHKWGNDNVAIGDSALYSDSIGRRNVAVGKNAIFSNMTGNDNIASGFESLYSNTTGFENTASGYKSLHSNTTGDKNIASGPLSLYSNTTGSTNIGIGFEALYSNTTGSGNVAIGTRACLELVTGSYNTAIGFAAGGTNELNSSNSTLIGYGVPFFASNLVRIGNSSVTSIGGQVGWTTLSDERVKNNITDGVRGLDFIMKLRPVTYKYSLANIYERIGRVDSSNYLGKNDIEKITFSGFLAQEVEQAAKSVGYDFSGVDLPKNEKDLYGIRYGDFVVPIVKAMQEQQKTISEQKTTISQMQMTIMLLEQRLRALEETRTDTPVVK